LIMQRDLGKHVPASLIQQGGRQCDQLLFYFR
jgi:hypothetical protein